jgi:hypothetical protein
VEKSKQLIRRLTDKRAKRESLFFFATFAYFAALRETGADH